MTSAAVASHASLHQQRSMILQGFLWVLVAIGGASFALNALLFGKSALTLEALVPSVLFCAVVLTALWLDRRQRSGLAIAVVLALTLPAAGLPVILAGAANSASSLLLFFLPLSLAGLVLKRSTLHQVAGVTLLAVLVAPLLQGAGLSAADPADTQAAWAVALQFCLIYVAVAAFLARFGAVLRTTLHDAIEQKTALEAEARERRRAQTEVVEGRSFNEALIESLPGIFYLLDESGRCIRWNRNFTRIFGYSDDDMPHLNPVDFVEPKGRAAAAKRIRDAFELGFTTVETNLVTRHGELLPFVVTGTRVTLGGQHYLAGIGLDRSEVGAANARAEALNTELAERYERIKALREIDTAISASLDLTKVLTVLLEQVTERLHVDAAMVLLYDADNESLRPAATHGFAAAEFGSAPLSLGEGIAGRAAVERRHMLVNGAEELARAFSHIDAIEKEGFTSCKAVPLVANHQLQGVLQLFHRFPILPEGEWREFLDALATQAAIAIDHATLLESLERSNNELRQAYDTTIEGWAHALDLKDEETAGHSERVTDLALRLASHLGVTGDDLTHIRRGALLHDIGKMGVPDNILRKPGKLDADEWVVMRQHTTYARDLLTPIPFLRPAIDIPYAHHEKWDGSGYPRGLKGEEIPIAARIFAVVDVYDALTSDRPYREAWSEERALDHIRAQAGTHFDPEIAGAFCQLMTPAQRSGDARQSREKTLPATEASGPLKPALNA